MYVLYSVFSSSGVLLPSKKIPEKRVFSTFPKNI